MTPVSVSILIPVTGTWRLKLSALVPPYVLDVDPPEALNALEYMAIPCVVAISLPAETVMESLTTMCMPICATTESESVTLTVMSYAPTAVVPNIVKRPVTESMVIPGISVVYVNFHGVVPPP